MAKIENLYDLSSFKAFNDARKSEFADAASGVVLARNLTHVDPQIFEKKYPDNVFMGMGITVDNSGGYVQDIQSLRVLIQGEFRNTGDRAGNKGKFSLNGEQSKIRVVEREAEASWSDTEEKQAALQNFSIVGKFMEGFNMQYQREIDEAGLVGINGNQGILTYTGYASDTAPGTIDTLSADEMYAEFEGLINNQWDAVNNTSEYMGNRIVTSPRIMNKLRSTILNSANGAMSVLKALNENFPEITWFASHRADSVNGGGSVSTLLNPSDQSLKMRIPQPLMIGELIKKGSFHSMVEAKYRVAGADILEDTAGRRLLGL